MAPHGMPRHLLALALTGPAALILMTLDAQASPGDRQGETIPREALGSRPFALVDHMDAGSLKRALEQCASGPFFRTDFSIGHRGAPRGFPEHTRESYRAAVRQGAGIVECDVTFTRDRVLVCRHSQCDLHTTTNILATDLADRCSEPFTPADAAGGQPASARCCTSDVTLAQFQTLCGRQDAVDVRAGTVADYLKGPADSPGDPNAICGTLMTHAESVELFDGLGAGMTPELKAPEVAMPYQGDYTQADYARQMIEEYEAAGVDPDRVWAQSFDLEDVRYWIESHPRFGRQVVYLDGRFDSGDMLPGEPETFEPTMDELARQGVRIVAPPLWVLLTLDDNGRIVPSAYAAAARAAGLRVITWTLERSDSLEQGGGYYYQSISDAIDDDGDIYTVLDVLARDVGVMGVFSDWPATVTYYASCRVPDPDPPSGRARGAWDLTPGSG